jgi:hypothetical protein
LTATKRKAAPHRGSRRRRAAQHDGSGIEALIAEAHERGLRINNLFETGGAWQANVADGDMFFAFGRGGSAAEALRAALDHKKPQARSTGRA